RLLGPQRVGGGGGAVRGAGGLFVGQRREREVPEPGGRALQHRTARQHGKVPALCLVFRVECFVSREPKASAKRRAYLRYWNSALAKSACANADHVSRCRRI